MKLRTFFKSLGLALVTSPTKVLSAVEGIRRKDSTKWATYHWWKERHQKTFPALTNDPEQEQRIKVFLDAELKQLRRYEGRA